jgi:hypothetical protein
MSHNILSRSFHLALGATLFTSALSAQPAQELGRVPALPQPSVDALAAPSAERFLAVAAELLGRPASEVTLGALEGPVTFLDAGFVLYVQSAFAGETKAVVALDALGRHHDLGQAALLDAALAEAARGKLTRALEQQYRAKPRGEALGVMVWVATPSVEVLRAEHSEVIDQLDRDDAGTAEAVASAQAQLDERIRMTVSPVTSQLADQLRALGLTVMRADDIAPVVFCQLTEADAAKVQALPGVLSLDFCGNVYEERLDVAHREVRADLVHTASMGTQGAGVRVAIVEGGRVCNSHPNMSVTATRSLLDTLSDHTTAVGACVRSTHPLHRGVAPAVSLYSASGARGIPEAGGAISWAAANGCRIQNLSYGSPDPGPTVYSFDHYLDWVVRNHGLTLTIACGNSGLMAGYVGDPGAGYNAIAVGNFDDRGTSAWSGEVMWPTSSWRNPSTGVESPQVAAPGARIRALSCDGGTNYEGSGTSFSAPIVAGTAALMQATRPVLGSYPEAMRAILMATAWHNIEGAAALSSRDGAGGIDAKAAFSVSYRTGSHAFGTLYNGSFGANNRYVAQRTFATAGQRLRCALSWNSTPEGGPNYSTSTLRADFDLAVVRPDGIVVAYSNRALQPFEIVDFVAPLSGYYELHIVRRSFTGTLEFFGTAMSSSGDI